MHDTPTVGDLPVFVLCFKGSPALSTARVVIGCHTDRARAVAPPTERGSLENHQRRGSFVSSRFASLVLRLGYAAPARRERQTHQICRLPGLPPGASGSSRTA